MNVGSVPPDPEDMNNKRAAAAGQALLDFAVDFGETDDRRELGSFAQQNLADLLTNFAHYCDRQGISLLACLSKARSNYAEETDSFGRQFSALEVDFFPHGTTRAPF
jgi:hypothetical protein